MGARLPSGLLIKALIRRVHDAGGFAAVLMRGAEDGGAILVQTLENGQFHGFFETMRDFDGNARLVRSGPDDGAGAEARAAYVARRRNADGDLWLVELDIADAERFAAETIAG